MAETIQEMLVHFLPIFIVIGRAPGANTYQGLVENSFSMDWSPTNVRLWWSGAAYSIIGEHRLQGDRDAEDQRIHYTRNKPDWLIESFDAMSDECPIEINFDRWLTAIHSEARNKFAKRNAIFSMKDK